MGSPSLYMAVQWHIRLKCEISVVLSLLKAAVDEVPKKTIELTTRTLREAGSFAPIYWELVLPQLYKGVTLDTSGMAYVPDDPDERDGMDSMVELHAKPKAKPKPKVSKPKPKKGAASSPRGVNAGRTKPQATPPKRAESPSNEAPVARGDEEQAQQERQQLVTPQKGNRSPTLEPKGKSPSQEGLENFANLVSGGTSPAAQPQ